MVAALLAAVTIWHLLPGVEGTPFHRDEARWVHRAYLLNEWVEPFSQRWQDDGYPLGENSWDERYRMRDQPPFAPYVLGLGLLVQGHDIETNGFWVMEHDDAWNVEHGNMPSRAVLLAARRVDVVIAAVTVALVYLLAMRLSTRLGGIIAALYLAFNPLLLDTATRAWADPLLVLLLTMSALVVIRLGEHPSWRWTATLGILLGLGAATKLSPLLSATALGLLGLTIWFAILWRAQRPSAVPTIARYLIAVPLITFVAFVAAYPYLWVAPIRHTYRLFAFRIDSFDSQASAWPNAAVNSPLEAARRIIDSQSWYSTGRYVAERLGTPVAFTEWPTVGLDDLDLVLAIVGALILFRHVRHTGILSGPGLLGIFLALQVALIVLTMGVDYPRYHLPITLVVALLVGTAIGTAVERAWTWWSRQHLATHVNIPGTDTWYPPRDKRTARRA